MSNEDDWTGYYDKDDDDNVGIPDIGDTYRGLVPEITEQQVRDRRALMRSGAGQKPYELDDDQMARLLTSYNNIYDKPASKLLLRQPAEYDKKLGNRLGQISQVARLRQRTTDNKEKLNQLKAAITAVTGKTLSDLEMNNVIGQIRNAYNNMKKSTSRSIKAAMRAKHVVPLAPKKDTPEYDELQKQKLEKKYRSRVHAYYPRFITDPQYNTYLDNPEYQGEKEYKAQYDDFVDKKGNPIFSRWEKKTPQQLPMDERNKVAYLFGEMSGILGLHPKFDPRFLTKKSAAAALHDTLGEDGKSKDYIYEMIDMDKDKRSPGSLVVKRADNGQIIAIDGYVLNDAKESAEVQRLKNMIYYNMNPTPGERKITKRSDFMTRFKKAANKYRSAGLKDVKELIEDYIINRQHVNVSSSSSSSSSASYNQIKPPATKWNPLTRKNESVSDVILEVTGTVIRYGRNNNGSVQTRTYSHAIINRYKVPLIAWRSIISSVAELFAQMYIYPTIPFDELGLGELKSGFGKQTFDKLGEGETPGNFMVNWKNTYTDDAVESYVLRNKYVQNWIYQQIIGLRKSLVFGLPEELNEYDEDIPKSDIDDSRMRVILTSLINVVCMFHMNGLENDMFNSGYVFDLNQTDVVKDWKGYYQNVKPQYTLMNGDTSNVQNTLTSRSWDKVKAMWGIQERGAELVGTLTQDSVKQPFYDDDAKKSELRDYGYRVPSNYRRTKVVKEISEDDDNNISNVASSSSSSSMSRPN